MGVTLVAEVLLSGFLPLLTLWMVADVLQMLILKDSFYWALRPSGSVLPPASIAGVAVAYILGSVSHAVGRTVLTLQFLLGRESDDETVLRLNRVLQRASPALSESLLYGARIVFVNKVVAAQVPLLGIAFVLWLHSRNVMSEWIAATYTVVGVVSLAAAVLGWWLHRMYCAWHSHMVRLADDALSTGVPHCPSLSGPCLLFGPCYSSACDVHCPPDHTRGPRGEAQRDGEA